MCTGVKLWSDLHVFKTMLLLFFLLWQVLSGVTSDMKIAQEEVFGPVMTIIKVPRNSDEECIRMVNSSKYDANKLCEKRYIHMLL